MGCWKASLQSFRVASKRIYQTKHRVLYYDLILQCGTLLLRCALCDKDAAIAVGM